MSNYTFATVLMAFLASNLLLILTTLCICNIKIMVNVGHKLLAAFILFTLLRFLLPLESPFSITISMSEDLSAITAYIQGKILVLPYINYTISPWNFFQIIWFFGVFILLLIYIVRYCITRYRIIQYRKDVTLQDSYAPILQRVCTKKGKRNTFKIYELSIIETPRLFGIFHPWILIPEGNHYSEMDLYYTFSHEAAYHFHHDLLIKTIIKLITILYWWNPFCYRLNKQTAEVLEMHADNSLVGSNHEIAKEYMHTLIRLSENAQKDRTVPRLYTMSLFPEKISDTQKRFYMMTFDQSKRNRPLNAILLLITLSIFVLSYSFIFEADYVAPTDYDHFIFDMGYYALDNGDGSYNIYTGYVLIETVNTLDLYPDVVVIRDASKLPTAYTETSPLE